tara:strand:+ start:3079 stop:3354 length:276 start_codon:yes stop_codon:yes gene_type:complete
MSRYNETKKIRGRNSEKIHYSTTIYQKIEEKNDDMYFIAQEGDRCDNLAFRFYGDSTLWWFIARVNNLKTNNIPIGTSLRIPTSTENARGL